MIEQMTTNLKVVQRDKQYIDNVFSTLKMKNEDLHVSLQHAIEQRDLAKSEILTLYAQIEAMNTQRNDANDMFLGMFNTQSIFE